MKSPFSWFFQKNESNQFIKKSSEQDNQITITTYGSTSNLRVEKPSQNSVIIEGSKQNISANSSPQRHPPVSIRNKEKENLNDENFNFFSLKKNSLNFSHQKTFNETNLFDLGVDLYSESPLLPKLKSIVSEIPFGNETKYYIPDIYQNIENIEENEENFIKKASDECLFFIFNSKPRTISQKMAANELKERGFKYDGNIKTWINKNGFIFDINQWKFIGN